MTLDAQTLTTNFFNLFKGELKDLWKKEDDAFLQKLAQDIAEQKILAMTSSNPEEHRKNLLHLAATLDGEISRTKLKLNKLGEQVFTKMLAFGIKALVCAI